MGLPPRYPQIDDYWSCTAFLILNELNSKNSVTASKNWTLNATAAARKKFDGGLTGQSTTSDSMEIRLVKSAKFDGAGV